MKNSKSILITISLILGIVIFSNFQNKPDEYVIVSGWMCSNETETTYYVWNGVNTIQVQNKNEVLRIMQNQGFELVSAYSKFITRGNNISETWIFKK